MAETLIRPTVAGKWLRDTLYADSLITVPVKNLFVPQSTDFPNIQISLKDGAVDVQSAFAETNSPIAGQFYVLYVRKQFTASDTLFDDDATMIAHLKRINALFNKSENVSYTFSGDTYKIGCSLNSYFDKTFENNGLLSHHIGGLYELYVD